MNFFLYLHDNTLVSKLSLSWPTFDQTFPHDPQSCLASTVFRVLISLLEVTTQYRLLHHNTGSQTTAGKDDLPKPSSV